VRYNLNVTCAPGFVFNDSLHCVPAEVTVTGPASLIERMDPITIEDVQLEPLNEDLNQAVSLVIPQQQYITIEPKSVKLEAGIEKLVNVTSSVNVEMVGDTATIGLARKSVNLSYSVGQSKQNNPELDAIRVIARIGPDEMSVNSVKLELADVPAYVTSVRITPDSLALSSLE